MGNIYQQSPANAGQIHDSVRPVLGLQSIWHSLLVDAIYTVLFKAKLDLIRLKQSVMKFLCLLLGHRWYYWTQYRSDQNRRCMHRQCWHCLKLEVDIRHPEEPVPWWTVFNTKEGKLARQ